MTMPTTVTKANVASADASGVQGMRSMQERAAARTPVARNKNAFSFAHLNGDAFSFVPSGMRGMRKRPLSSARDHGAGGGAGGCWDSGCGYIGGGAAYG